MTETKVAEGSTYDRDGGSAWQGMMDDAPAGDGRAELSPEMRELVDATASYFEALDKHFPDGLTRDQDRGPAPAEIAELEHARERVETATERVLEGAARPGPQRAGADTALADDLMLHSKAAAERVGKAVEELGRGD